MPIGNESRNRRIYCNETFHTTRSTLYQWLHVLLKRRMQVKLQCPTQYALCMSSTTYLKYKISTCIYSSTVYTRNIHSVITSFVIWIYCNGHRWFYKVIKKKLRRKILYSFQSISNLNVLLWKFHKFSKYIGPFYSLFKLHEFIQKFCRVTPPLSNVLPSFFQNVIDIFSCIMGMRKSLLKH